LFPSRVHNLLVWERCDESEDVMMLIYTIIAMLNNPIRVLC
jgi:hypothetical protein